MADSTRPFEVLAYIANEHNPNFLGPAPLDHIAEQVVRSRGPSGENTEYVLELARAMRTIAPHVADEHLFTLEGKVLELLAISRSGHPLVNSCETTQATIDEGGCGHPFTSAQSQTRSLESNGSLLSDQPDKGNGPLLSDQPDKGNGPLLSDQPDKGRMDLYCSDQPDQG